MVSAELKEERGKENDAYVGKQGGFGGLIFGVFPLDSVHNDLDDIRFRT